MNILIKALLALILCMPLCAETYQLKAGDALYIPDESDTLIDKPWFRFGFPLTLGIWGLASATPFGIVGGVVFIIYSAEQINQSEGTTNDARREAETQG